MCFSLDWIKQLLILAVVVFAIVGILQLLIPYVITKMGITLGDGANVVIGVFRIAFIAAIVILVIIICFTVIACLWHYVGGMSLLPH